MSKNHGRRYEDAGENAPLLVQQVIAQFRTLAEEERADKPLLYWLLGSATPPYKESKADAAYVAVSQVPGQDCENCRFAYENIKSGRLICSLIDGYIHLSGWCLRWTP